MIIGLAGLLFLGQTGRVFASTIEEIRRQQEQNRQQLNNIEGQISGLAGKQENVGAEIEAMDQELVTIIASVEMIQEEIQQKEEEIKVTEEEYQEAKLQEEEQYAAMKLRIKFMYEQGDSSYVQMLLNSESFGDMVNRADYISKIYEYDREMLEEYQAVKEYVRYIWDCLEEEKAELEVSRHELEEEQAYMEEVLAGKRREYENYSLQLAQARQEAAAYKTRIRQQTAEIKRLEEEARKKAEEEARKKAEEEAKKKEEARKKAEEEAKKQAGEAGSEQTGDSSDGGESTSQETGNESGQSGQEETKTQKPAADPEPKPAVSSGNSSKGQEIANYACKFVGNPYVLGGTSLTNGADCSGFIWKVYQDHGYSIPRTSATQRSAGREVGYANAQPGDIICYAGHVGLYIGNGNIVHASTPKSGIKISKATYKTILAVRRIV